MSMRVFLKPSPPASRDDRDRNHGQQYADQQPCEVAAAEILKEPKIVPAHQRVGIVEAHHPDPAVDLEAAAIEAGANDFETLGHHQNDESPRGGRAPGSRPTAPLFTRCPRWLVQHGWSVVTSESATLRRSCPSWTRPPGRMWGSSSRKSMTTTTSSGYGRP